jgi:hypothetical protein
MMIEKRKQPSIYGPRFSWNPSKNPFFSYLFDGLRGNIGLTELDERPTGIAVFPF